MLVNKTNLVFRKKSEDKIRVRTLNECAVFFLLFIYALRI